MYQYGFYFGDICCSKKNIGRKFLVQQSCFYSILLQVPEYSPELDEEGICKMVFEIILYFDEAISIGHNKGVPITQVK